MKLFPILTLVVGVALSAEAQTSAGKYVPNASDMRIVEGKMYNRVLSTNWATLPAAGTSLEVVEVIADGLVVTSAPAGGAGDKMVIKHFPGESKLTKGKTLAGPFRALPVPALKYGSQTVAAYDCGLPNTPENRKTLKNGPIHGSQ